jgi:hypothetical protein
VTTVVTVGPFEGIKDNATAGPDYFCELTASTATISVVVMSTSGSDPLADSLLWGRGQETDPDEGLEFRPEFAERLRAYLRDRPRGKPLDEVVRDLGLDE